MIDPSVPTNFNRTQSELEEWLLFCVVVAGKSSSQQAKKLDQFLGDGVGSPFEKIRDWEKSLLLMPKLRESKLGQYNRLYNCFRLVTGLNLKKTSVAVLEGIPGIGPKTARFFVLHSRPNQNIAVLDTHILSWLREQGYATPKSTPSGKKYLEIEQWFLNEAKKRNMSIAELDIQIWNERKRHVADFVDYGTPQKPFVSTSHDFEV